MQWVFKKVLQDAIVDGNLLFYNQWSYKYWLKTFPKWDEMHATIITLNQ